MSDGFVYNQYLGELDTLDGVTCGIALFDGTYVPNRASTTVGSLTGELTGGSYTRQTFAASYAIESNDGVLRIDEADQWPLFDIAGKAWQYAVFYKNSDGTVISYLPYSPQIGTDNMPIQPLNGFARAANGAGLAARIAALEEAVDGIESGVPTVIAGGNAAVQGVQIQDRSDVALAWTTANPVLALGERGDESDTGLFKIGDSVTAWNDLGYTPRRNGDWVDLLPAPEDATLPGYVNPQSILIGYDAPGWPGMRYRILASGQVEFMGAALYLDGMGDPASPTPGGLILTLPAEAWPLEAPPLVVFELDVSLVSSFSTVAVLINGEVHTSSAMTGVGVVIPSVVWDPA